MYSDTSLLQARPPALTLRSRTSVPIISVVASTSSAATSMSASSRRPYQRDSTVIARPHRHPGACRRIHHATCSDARVWVEPGHKARDDRGFGRPARLLRKQFLELGSMLRALADHARPSRLVGLLAEVVAKRDHLDASRLLLGDVRLV